MYLRFLFFPVILYLGACSSESKVASGPLVEIPVDSIIPSPSPGDTRDTSQYEAPILEMPTESMPSKMLGSWQAIELRIGDLIMTGEDFEKQGISPPIRYFSSQKYMQFGRPSGELPRIPFTYFEGEIRSQDNGKEQVVYLGADTLILSADIDGEISTYIFRKLK